MISLAKISSITGKLHINNVLVCRVRGFAQSTLNAPSVTCNLLPLSEMWSPENSAVFNSIRGLSKCLAVDISCCYQILPLLSQEVSCHKVVLCRQQCSLWDICELKQKHEIADEAKMYIFLYIIHLQLQTFQAKDDFLRCTLRCMYHLNWVPPCSASSSWDHPGLKTETKSPLINH